MRHVYESGAYSLITKIMLTLAGRHELNRENTHTHNNQLLALYGSGMWSCAWNGLLHGPADAFSISECAEKGLA